MHPGTPVRVIQRDEQTAFTLFPGEIGIIYYLNGDNTAAVQFLKRLMHHNVPLNILEEISVSDFKRGLK